MEREREMKSSVKYGTSTLTSFNKTLYKYIDEDGINHVQHSENQVTLANT